MIYLVSGSQQHWPTEKCLVCQQMGLCHQTHHPFVELKAAALKPLSASALSLLTLRRNMQHEGHVKRAGTCQSE